MAPSWFRRWLLPGFIFQSVVIAGGYGTGREIAEFFLTLGPRGGLAAIAVSTVVWSVVCAVTFEFARVTGATEYRGFFRELLGRAGIVYEVCWGVFMLIVLSVIAAAAGGILRDTFGLPYLVGVLAMVGAIGALIFRGASAIESFLSLWSFALYGVYVVLFVWALRAFGGDISAGLATSNLGSDWFVGGIRYAGYNLAIVPAILFCIRYVRTRRDALVAGALAGPIAMVPGLLFFVAMIGFHPEILALDVPATLVLERLGSRGFQVVFQVVLLGTLVETGTGMIHAVNERIARVVEATGRSMTSGSRTIVALAWLVGGAFVAQFGLIGLIARGYGTLTWAFIVVFVVPVLTLGVARILSADREGGEGGEGGEGASRTRGGNTPA